MTVRASDSMFLCIDFVRVTNCFTITITDLQCVIVIVVVIH